MTVKLVSFVSSAYLGVSGVSGVSGVTIRYALSKQRVVLGSHRIYGGGRRGFT